MKSKFAIILIFTITCVYSKNQDYSEVDELRSRLFDLDDLFKNAGRSSPGEGTYTRLVQTYENFGQKMEKVKAADSKNHLKALNSLWLWAKVKEETKNIEGLYAHFRSRLNDTAAKKVPFNLEGWAALAQTILNDPNIGVPSALNRIADTITDDNLFISAYQETKEQICNEQQSPQQLLYNLYNTIALTEMKGYAMMQFSYALLKLYNNGNFSEESERTKSKYYERTAETLRAVKTAMAFAPRELWKCDPGVHKEGSTYIELKQLFQGYVVNEVDLNTKTTCKENCAYYSLATVQGCYDNQYCAQQRRCNGKVVNCHYIDSDMWICPSSKTSDRRYEYIEYENGRVYGNKKTCKRGTTKVDSWWRWLFWHCSYCMCFCDDHNSSSDRYFSLREVTSNVEQNRVITGLKLAKVNKIVHLVIQHAELLGRAGINESTVEWKKVNNFTVLDQGVENGRDYHTLSWEKRALDLDDLIAPDGHVLTGVRFRMVGAHLNFEIRVTPFNFTTGQLIKPMEKSTWLSNDNTDVKNSGASEKTRTECKLVKPGIPTSTSSSSVPDSRTNQYLNFAPTDLEKDAGQTTIPFLDIQAVETYPAFPLSGAGIYHKGRKGSGGFVALRIITYDFQKHLKADLPPQPSVLGVNEIPTV